MTKIKQASVLCLTLILLSLMPIASAEYQEEKTEIEKFLKQDDTNKRCKDKNISSKICSHWLAQNASKQNITLGRVYMHNATMTKPKKGYYFNYYITEEGYFFFINPKQDKALNYHQAKQKYKNTVIGHTRYYYYYPFDYYEGAGFAPDWLVRATAR